MDQSNASETGQPQRPRWAPYLVGALLGALVTVAAVVVFEVAGGDDDHEDSTVTTITGTAPTSTSPAVTSPRPAPATGAPQGTVPLPPAIVSFGVETTNCPPGAASTAVVVTYQTQNATSVGFSIDGGASAPGADTSGAQRVGPIPCDAQPHVITLTAENGQLRATRQATVSVS